MTRWWLESLSGSSEFVSRHHLTTSSHPCQPVSGLQSAGQPRPAQFRNCGAGSGLWHSVTISTSQRSVRSPATLASTLTVTSELTTTTTGTDKHWALKDFVKCFSWTESKSETLRVPRVSDYPDSDGCVCVTSSSQTDTLLMLSQDIKLVLQSSHWKWNSGDQRTFLNDNCRIISNEYVKFRWCHMLQVFLTKTKTEVELNMNWLILPFYCLTGRVRKCCNGFARKSSGADTVCKVSDWPVRTLRPAPARVRGRESEAVTADQNNIWRGAQKSGRAVWQP